MFCPDYQNSIVNLPNSILQWMALPHRHSTLSLMDQALKQGYESVVVLLLDGLGTRVIRDNLDQNGFLATHLVDSFSSVFPPTTVAATTSCITGLQPVEHCWLGWDCYYPQLRQTVTVFRNTLSNTDIPAADFPVAQTFCPYRSVVDMIRSCGGQAYNVTPFQPPFPENFSQIAAYIRQLTERSGKKYIYAYWTEPDSTMHRTGCRSAETKTVLRELERQVEALAQQLHNTLLIVTADHGHIDATGFALEDLPVLADCMLRPPSIEPRAVSFHIKPGREAEFSQQFLHLFSEKFLLLSKAEVKASGLFGSGQEHPCFDAMLGDFLAVATGDQAFYHTREQAEHFIGVHAGLTEDEMMIPFIAIPT